jgi:hypothetical protein
MKSLTLRVTYDNTITDLDIDQDLPLKVDLSAVENQSLGQIFGIGSQTVDLPGTTINNTFFKHAYKLESTGIPSLYNSIDAVLLLNGEVILEGKLSLDDILTDDNGFIVYKITITDNIIGLVKDLDNRLIKDLDFSKYNHYLTKENILKSWLNPTSSQALLSGSIFYPLADYGNDDVIPYPTLPRIQFSNISGPFSSGSINQEASPMRVQQFLPAIRTKDLIDVIFDDVQYEYSSSLFDSDDFKQTYVLPKSNEKLGIISPVGYNNFIASMSVDTNIPSVVGGGFTEIPLSFDVEILDSGSNYNPTTSRYKAPADGEYIIRVAMEADNVSRLSGSSTYYLLISNMTTGISLSAQQYLMIPSGPDLVDMAMDIKAELKEDDEVKVRLFVYNTDSGINTTTGKVYHLRQNLNTPLFRITSSPNSYDNALVKMGDQFDPTTKSIDMLKGLIHKFNLVFDIDKINPNVILIEPFDKWLSLGKVVDWTEKVEYAKKISIKNTISEQSKELVITDEKDNDRFNKILNDQNPEPYGSIKLTSESDKTKGKKEIKGIFAPLILGNMLLSGSINSDGTPTFNLGYSRPIPHLYKQSDSKQPTFKFKPRIGYRVDNLDNMSIFYVGKKGVEGVDYTTVVGYSTLSNYNQLNSSIGTNVAEIKNLDFNNTYTKFIERDTYPTDNISFTDNSNTAFNSYWKNYIEGLYWDENQKLNLDIKFTPEEYKNIKLNDKIQIKNQYYRINKISGFNLQYPDVVTVELIKYYDKVNTEYTNIPAIIKQQPSYNDSVPTPGGGLPTTCYSWNYSYNLPSGDTDYFSYLDCNGDVQESDVTAQSGGASGGFTFCALAILSSPGPFGNLSGGSTPCS